MSCYKIISTNKKANFDFFIEDKFEAGLVLIGSEVKSLRKGKVNFVDSHITIDDQFVPTIHNMHIAEYEFANRFNHNPTRIRKLLLNKKEIRKLYAKVKIKGYSIVPLKLFFNNKNIAKLEIALAKGKKIFDKRQSIKEKEWNRSKERNFKLNT